MSQDGKKNGAKEVRACITQLKVELRVDSTSGSQKDNGGDSSSGNGAIMEPVVEELDKGSLPTTRTMNPSAPSFTPPGYDLPSSTAENDLSVGLPPEFIEPALCNIHFYRQYCHSL